MRGKRAAATAVKTDAAHAAEIAALRAENTRLELAHVEAQARHVAALRDLRLDHLAEIDAKAEARAAELAAHRVEADVEARVSARIEDVRKEIVANLSGWLDRNTVKAKAADYAELCQIVGIETVHPLLGGGDDDPRATRARRRAKPKDLRRIDAARASAHAAHWPI